MMGSRAMLYVLWFWLFGQVVIAQICYFPNGEQAVNDTPCTASSVSICCQQGATCLGNGLCFDPHGSAVGGYIRGSCTDRSWRSPNCPQYCTYDNVTAQLYNSLSDAGVLSCGKSEFCCQSDPLERCNCQTRNGTFKLSGGLVPFTTIDSILLTTMMTTESTSSTFTSSSLPSTVISSAGSLTFTSSTTSSTFTSPASSSTSTSSTLSTPPSNSSNDDASKIGLGVGLGVGISIALGLFGLLAYLIIRHRRSRRGPNTVQLVRPPNEHTSPQPTKYLYGYGEPNIYEAPEPTKHLYRRPEIYEAPA